MTPADEIAMIETGGAPVLADEIASAIESHGLDAFRAALRGLDRGEAS